MFNVNKPAAARVFLRLKKRQRRCFKKLAGDHGPCFSSLRCRGLNLNNVLLRFDIIMFKSRHFFLYPMLVKHIHSSGQVTLHSVLVSDAIDSHGTRLVQYPNGAEVPISEERFIQLELAQPDLSSLTATPLPEEVTRFNSKH